MTLHENSTASESEGGDLERIDMLANVSHEIRNPLNAIIGMSHLLKNSNSKEEQEEYLDALTQTSESLLEIANNLMDFSKLNSGKLRLDSMPVNLKKRIPKNLLWLKIMAKSKDLYFDIELDDEIPDSLIADPIKLRQVLINLLSNAIKFTTHGGVRLRVSLGEKTAEEAVLVFSVRDTGMGISEEYQEEIFKPFNQGEDTINATYGGTGLGLTISKRILELMGTTLKVVSQPENGSEFYSGLKLKIVPKVFRSREVEVADVPQAGLKVLVVDDNKLNRMVAQRSLQQWGIASKVAGNGKEALWLLEREDFDLVLLDLRMPVMNGYETMEEIRRLVKNEHDALPVIALSGSLGEREQDDLVGSGFSDYLLKPYRPEELLRKITFLFPAE